MEPPYVHGRVGATDDGTERIGPYRVLTPWDGDTAGGAARSDGHGAAQDARRCLARDDRRGRTVVLTLPHPALVDDPAYRVRFRAEAENSRRVTGRWTAPVEAIAPADAPLPWVAHGCFPALTLPSALAVHGGPLPEPVVRALGVALAETLVGAHANGLVFAGVSPGAVLLTADGPRLTGYGLVRAAALDRTERAGLLGVDSAALPPEQRAGERPHPHGDVYAFGAVLAYAATGRIPGGTAASPGDTGALPEAFRGVITACLSVDPAHRPQPAALFQALRTSTGSGGGGLPEPIATALAEQVARHPVEVAPDATEPTGRDEGSGPSRRSLTLGGLAGVAGLVLGSGGVAAWRATADDGPTRPAPLSVRGAAPAPLWRRDIDFVLEGPPVLAGGEVALMAGTSAVTAVRLRDGKKLWTRENMWASQTLMPLAGGLFLSSRAGMAESEFAAVSVRTGKVTWTERRYDGGKLPAFLGPLANRGNTLWFMAGTSGGGDRPKPMVIAYDLEKREELWRTPLSSFGSAGDEQGPGVPNGGTLIVENNGPPGSGFLGTEEKTWSYAALRQRDGKTLWTRTYDGVTAAYQGVFRTVAPGDLLIASDNRAVRAHDLTSGRRRWRFTTKGYMYTKPAIRGRTLCVTDEDSVTYAVDTRTGRLRWRHAAAVEAMGQMRYSETVISHAGRTVLQMNASEIDALNAADGSLRWRFTPVGSGQGAGAFSGYVDTAPGLALVVNGSSLYALPVD
ncbi:PQQ-binding-like beta-propeller repeat protein [Streptomyces sp. NPDC007983]|uniref:outer membrane protein assembly factor BamB family protein n=1 Tax=Streptomyces sp. NPDC007983 TaxID=3364800 RepID=UPI0036E2035F